jgi:flagellar protein FlgJ
MDVVPTAAATRPTVPSTPKGADPGMVKAAREFEAIFVQQLVKAMRQASSASGPGLLTGKKTRAYQDMLDEEMARAMAQSGGLGVADFMLRDMVRRKGAGQKKDSSPAPDAPMVMAEANRPPGGAR